MVRRIGVILVFAGAAAVLRADIVSARKGFERLHGEPFRRSKLVAAGAAPQESHYEKAPGKSVFKFAMPYANDRRLQFMSAEFDGGKFVSAQLHVLGFEPEALDETAFNGLRESKTMLGVRADLDAFNPVVVLYPARSRQPSFVATDDMNLDVDPVSRQLGVLGGSLGRLDISTAGLSYRVTLTGRDGLAVDLGVATAKNRIPADRVIANIRAALEKRDPARKGRISDRDVIDFRHGSTISYKAETP